MAITRINPASKIHSLCRLIPPIKYSALEAGEAEFEGALEAALEAEGAEVTAGAAPEAVEGAAGSLAVGPAAWVSDDIFRSISASTSSLRFRLRMSIKRSFAV